MEEVDNVLRIFKEAEKALDTGDNVKLKELSNQTIHAASVEQDPDSIAVAVIIYSLSKIIERCANKKDYQKFKSLIKKAILSLENNKKEEFKKTLADMRKEVEKCSGKIKTYVQDVFRKASINKASKIYEHGISLEQTANLLGITLFELASYSGQTEVSEAPESKTLGVKERIKLVEEIFG